MIDFHLKNRSGVAPYMQLVQQVRQYLRLGMLSEGDQLPTVKEVVSRLAINPNTVLKAYRELEREGLVSPRPGVGTFVTRTVADDTIANHERLREGLRAWFHEALEAGLDADDIEALYQTTFHVTVDLANNTGVTP